jgi:hypothetical protein
MAEQTDQSHEDRRQRVGEIAGRLVTLLGGGPVSMEHLARLQPYLQPVGEPPSLRTVNGIGTALYGCYRPPEVAPLQFMMAWYCFYFLPLLPRGIYLVASDWPDSYRFYGQVSARDFLKLFGVTGGVRLLLSMIGYVLLRVTWLTVALIAGGLVVLGLRYGYQWVRALLVVP